MFSPSRFVVVDDKPSHLEGIVKTLAALGSASLAVKYEAAVPLRPIDFRGVRGLFMDLQLTDNLKTKDFARHYATIQGILEDCIAVDGGPFVLLLWTDAPDRAEELYEYLKKNILPEKIHALPAALLPLSKADFITIATGEMHSPDLLRKAVEQQVNTLPAFAALVQWEMDVLASAGRVLADLIGLVPTTDRIGVGGETALANIALRLANAAVGARNVANDRREATHLALLPLLSDHAHNLPVQGDVEKLWSASHDKATVPLPTLTISDVAILNSRLHVVDHAKRTFLPTDWGAVSELSRVTWGTYGVRDRNAFLEDGLGFKGGAYGIKVASDLDAVEILQLRVGAACDYAQKADGPVPFVLCALANLGTSTKPYPLPPNSHNWISPPLEIAGRLVQMVVNPRFQFARSPGTAKKLKPVWRLRESILMELLSQISFHGSRPGIIRFP